MINLNNKLLLFLFSYMIRKLYSVVSGECCVDNPDSPQHQEILLPGHLYNMILKEKVFDWLTGIKAQLRTTIRLSPERVDFHDSKLYIIISKIYSMHRFVFIFIMLLIHNL